MEILGLIAINVLFQTAEPIILLKRLLFKEEEYEEYTPIWRFFHRMLYCPACSGFWITLLITFNIYTAAICAIAAEWVYKKLYDM